MAKVLACYKWVLDEADIRIETDGSFNLGMAKGKISDYDRNTIAAACDIANKIGGTPVGLTFGTEASKPSLKDALSRGLEEAFWIHGNKADGADSALTAQCLAEAIKKIDDVSIVVCSEGSSDVFARQTAPRLGALLDMPVVTGVMAVSVEGNKIIAKRRLDNCFETVEASLPVVLSILPEMIAAPIPGLKAIMAAKKKPVSEFAADDLIAGKSASVKTVNTKGYVVNRKMIRIEEDSPAASAAALIEALGKEGVL